MTKEIGPLPTPEVCQHRNATMREQFKLNVLTKAQKIHEDILKREKGKLVIKPGK